MADDALINKYRPRAWQHVLGQPALVKALQKAVRTKAAHGFLFTGPSGCGKTSLARLVARELGCQRPREIDGPTYAGVDNMRVVTESLRYRPLGEGDVRAIIIDECHAISKQAWQAVLKSIEEPPEWVYWFLCTTEPGRVPKTIITRCLNCEVKAVGVDALHDLLLDIAEDEAMAVSDEVIGLCAREADGSPRQAIQNLVLCAAVSDRREAALLLKTAEGSAEAVELARALVKGESWRRVCTLLRALGETNPESVRRVVQSYVTTMVLGGKGVAFGLQVLDAFAEPFNPSDGISSLVLAVGKVLFP